MTPFAVILAGGKGERFWPLSTSRRPKQLLALVGEQPLLAQAVARLHGFVPPDRIFILTNADLVEGCRAAAPVVPPEQIIGEPVGRDTAAAVALGTALVKRRDANGVFCVLTADHVIGDIPVFQKTLERAFERAANEDALITIGIPPTSPSTGFGYIEAGQGSGPEFQTVERFVEKPDAATARRYIESGRFYWNSGMFVWSVRAIEHAFRAHRPELADLINLPTIAAALAKYPALEKISIDYAVMEKARNILMIPARFAWDDVGAWTAIENHFPGDEAGNVLVGDAVSHAARGNLVYSRDHLTALVGVENLIVVQADGVTLVCARDRAQDIKKLVEQLRAGGRHARLL